MPTIKLDINTGLEGSPDGIGSTVELHNFIVGGDGSLYKMPALRNIKNTKPKVINNKVIQNKLLNFQKLTTTPIYSNNFYSNETGVEVAFYSTKNIRTCTFRSIFTMGFLNIDYENRFISNEELQASDYVVPPYKFNSEKEIFFSELFSDEKRQSTALPLSYMDAALNHFEMTKELTIKKGDKTKTIRNGYQFLFSVPNDYNGPRNPFRLPLMFISYLQDDNDCIARPTFSSKNIGENEEEVVEVSNFVGEDIGASIVGNRLVFYKKADFKIYVSEPNNFFTLMKNPDDETQFYVIEPTEEVEGMTDFNGDLIIFSPSGMDRWVFNANASSDDKRIILKDPTFKYAFRCRANGSWVKANKDLYFYTDSMEIRVLKSNLSVEQLFMGKLPVYAPFSQYFDSSKSYDISLRMSHFVLLGYRFVSLGNYLYNIDTQTWSTYTYDGFQNPEPVPGMEPGPDWEYIYENDLSKRVIQTGMDEIICTYSTMASAMSYKEMQKYFEHNPEAKNSLIEGEAQWGKMATLCTRMYQQESTVSVDGVLVYTRGGTLKKGDKIYLKILTGDENNAPIDENDKSTWGEPASYEPKVGTNHTGQFIWRCNVKCERFRLQITTDIVRGVIIQSVLADLTT